MSRILDIGRGFLASLRDPLGKRETPPDPRRPRGLTESVYDWDTWKYVTRKIFASSSDLPEAYRTMPWAYAAMMHRAQKLARLPVRVYMDEIVKDPKTGNPVARKTIQEATEFIGLMDKPNDYYSGFDLREATQICLDGAGVAYWQVKLNAAFQPVALYWLVPKYVTERPGTDGDLIAWYSYSVPGCPEERFQSSVAKAKAKGEFDFIAKFRLVSPISHLGGQASIMAAIQQLNLDYYIQDFQQRFFSKGSHHGRIFSPKNLLSDEAFDRFEQIVKSFHGMTRAHADWALNIPVEELGRDQSIKDMMFPQLDRVAREKITACLSTPPVILGLETANYATADIQLEVFWDALQSVSVKHTFTFDEIAQCFDSRYWTEYDFTDTPIFIKRKREQAALNSKFVVERRMTVNEANRRDGLPELPGGDELPPLPGPPPEGAPLSMRTKPNKTVMDKSALDLEKARRWGNELQRWENRFYFALRKYFAAQERRCARKLKDRFGGLKKQDEGKIEPDDIFDADEEAEFLKEMSQPFIRDAIKGAADGQLKDLKAVGAFDVTSPAVQQYIKAKVARFAGEVTSTTRDQLKAELEAGYAAGESEQQLSDRVARVFEGTARGTAARSRMIARTEMSASLNKGKMFGWEEAGVTRKRWLTVEDDSVRPGHQEMHNIAVAIDQPFDVPLYRETKEGPVLVAVEQMNFPGDDSLGASAGSIISCRCTCIAEFEE